jgi:hypothetical protein
MLSDHSPMRVTFCYVLVEGDVRLPLMVHNS